VLPILWRCALSTLRVTAGNLRGRRVPTPRDARPTSERARQAYFDIVAQRILDARFLDLFAGSGIFSFEAVSRGATEALAVEKSANGAAAIKRLAESWNVNVKVVAADVLTGIPRLGHTDFDLVYADPPYAYDRYDELLRALDRDAPLAGAAVVAIEHRRRTEPFTFTPHRLRATRRAGYGEVWITFFSNEGESG
jgi:16S rRNA (guanine966-N2)-methyltransferase